MTVDPNQTLEEIRELLAALCIDEESGMGWAHAYEFQEKFTALDDWLRKGGFFPHDWTYGVDQESAR